MGLCASKVAKPNEFAIIKQLKKHKPSGPEFLDLFDFKVHIVCINTAVPGSLEVLFMNEAAIATYGTITNDYKWPLIPMMGEKNIGLMIDSVISRNRPWKCITSDESGRDEAPSVTRTSMEEGSQSSDTDTPMQIYPAHTQIQRALVALQQQRKSQSMRRQSMQLSRQKEKSNHGGNNGNNALQHTPISFSAKTWFEIRCYPYEYEGQDAILVTQYNVTKHVQRNTALMRMADNHLRVLQQLYPKHFILDSPDGQSLMEHSDFGKFADHHDSVIVMFADIVGFTNMCKLVSPDQVMQFLCVLYQEFDKQVAAFPDLFKYEIAGDCYIVVGGLVNRDTNGFSSSTRQSMSKSDLRRLAIHMMKFCITIQDIAASMKMPHDTNSNVLLHIGLHLGPVVSGIIGLTSPKFMLFGDTMNTASRLESTCPAGKIQVSDEYFSLLPSGSIAGGGIWRKTKGVEVKGKGLMDTWVLVTSSPISMSPRFTNTSEELEDAATH